QSAVKAWNNATCATLDSSTTSTLRGITIYETIQPTIAGLNSTSSSNSSQISRQGASFKSAILPRTNCQTTQVVSGDSCAGLAARCGITAAQFTTFNPSSTLCSTLAVGEFVCCSSGTLPDLTPKENPDGSCFAYLVQSGDFCDSIAASNMITSAEIETWNAATWGWTSCSDLQTGMNICLSPGSPPMPVPISNAECGPQKPGTTTPPSGTDLASLNPCPLNVCCDIWGQCGTTPDFCTTTGINRCVSNCGQDPIVGNPPPEFRSIAYFEGYTTSRPCLYWDIGNVDARPYTHMHMAFAGLDSNFNVDVSDIQEQFNLFVRMLHFLQLLIVLGGWSFSNDPTTYMMFRNAVEPENWLTVAENIAIFIERNGLDGVDIDWEYPGATDIPGTPPGDPVNDGNNLLGLLLTLRSVLQPGLTISMAIPSSYWYLRNFPIATMAQVCDYFVFMTYDLHGQWDYGNAFSDPGCPGGNCLRSHVNYTETINAITMITKAGVPSGQVAVGVSSYGRSFQMVDPGCPTEMCEYTGPDSGALAGPCTDEPGYISNAEINGIIASNKAAKIYFDDNSYSNVMYYDDQWVAYMDDTNKATRALLYQEIALGGTADWAYDLAEFS
ncbi:glycoside hydrolase family 18 protein, partial [Stipitochalara longipes BDJ]